MNTGLFVGLNKGFVVQKPKDNPRRLKPAFRKGRISIMIFSSVIRQKSKNDSRTHKRVGWVHKL